MLNGSLQIIVYLAIIALLTKPVGLYLTKVFEGEKTWLTPVFRPIERLLYALFGVKEDEDQHWTKYASAMLVFSFFSIVATYGLLRLQALLPLNAPKLGGDQMPPHLAFNTADSFGTNTNWQSYIPEAAVSNFSNMCSLAFHNWASAASGIAVAVAIIRGFSRRNANGIGNFWVDMTRCTLYVLLPISLLASLMFVQQGVPQTLRSDYVVTAKTVEGADQKIPIGPVASQEGIKQVGTNGGGFYNANSAHPFENPTPFSDFMTKILIFLIPAGLTYMFGKMVGNVRQGWALFGAMSFLFLAGAFVCLWAEQAGNPNFTKLGVQAMNMEGKETRFGIGASTLFATVTTDASCGAVNSMHDSFTPLGGLVPLFNIMTGEVIFGGVGSGLYGMLMFAILGVFIAGLMVGRTPEYVGKKIERFEVQMAMLACLVLAGSILGFSALSANLQMPKDGPQASINTYAGQFYGATETPYGPATGNLNNSGAHGFSEVLYSYTSATGNNGSAFAGITANTPYYNATLAIAMLIGRFLMMVPLIAIAGNLAKKKYVPESAGTFPTDNGTFVVLLVGTILLVGALTFFPALSLGPIVEHYQMLQGVTK